jgi:6-phosphogluconolactonase (cycloisomerase 2 family)
MTFSRIGRIVKGLVASAALGLGMTACGGGTVGFMWVVGTQQTSTTNTGIITGFKIDSYTGNLTAMPGSPFGSGGASPAYLVIKPGGRFVYVINQAVGTVAGNVSVFSVGGDGTLLFQLSYSTQGNNPIWATFDSTGTYLYVLDQTAPSNTYCPPGFTTCGDITAFSVASDSGRLTLLVNNSIKVSGTQTPITYFPVAPNATMVTKASNGCIYTVSPTLVFPLQSLTSGQLSEPTTGPLYFTGSQNLTSINTTGSYTYLTDSGANTVYPLQAGGSGCSLAAVNPGIVANIGGTSLPVNSLTSNNNKFFYTINQSNLSNPQASANSNISAFTIDATTGRLQELSDPPNNPYSDGSGPTCIVEDTSNQYIYTSDSQSHTVTGKVLNQNTGQLSPLTRGSTFTLLGPPKCLAISGTVD